MEIRHIWFDFSDTIASIDKPIFERMMHEAYANATKRELTPAISEEYRALLKEKKSNASVFASLGLPAGYLSTVTGDRTDLYHLCDENIPAVLQELKQRYPISILSNSRLDTVLPALGISPEWFAHILGPDVVKNPKPALDGFYKMIQVSQMPTENILYIGDDIEKDLAPAKQVGMQTGLLWQESDVPDYCFPNFAVIVRQL